MRTSRLRHTLLLGLTLVLFSCLAGPPSVAPSGTLGPAGPGAGTRGRSAFAVVYAGPRGTVTDLRQPAVTILFNRAAHDAGGADDEGLPRVSVVTGDGRAVAGSWRWVGTHGILFAPERALAGSSHFVVTVAAGVRSLEGETLATDYRFEFTTARPAIVETIPAEGAEDVRPDTVFAVEFNEPVSPAEAERAVHLVINKKLRTVGVHATHAKTGGKVDETLLLAPAEPLPLDSAVELVIDKGLRGEGPLGTTAARALPFRTYGPIRLADLRCPRAGGPRCQAHRDFTVVLTNPVDPAEFNAHLKTPGLPRRAPAQASKSSTATTDAKGRPRKTEPSAEHFVAADPDFGKRYRVTLTAGMRDVFGQALDHDLGFDVDTEASFIAAGVPVGAGTAPNATPSQASTSTSSSDSDDGQNGQTVQDGQNAEPPPPSPDDPRPHRARLDYGVTLGLQGHVIEALAKQGLKAHKIPIGSVNIPSYAMSAAKIREDEVLGWIDRAAQSEGVDGHPQAHWAWTWVNPGAPENMRSVRSVDVDALLGGPAARGAALLAVALPGSMNTPTTDLVTVTDLAVSAKFSRYGSLVWVTRLSDGTPVSGAAVSVRKANKPELVAATTDATGVATLPAERFDPLTESGQVDRDAILFVHKGDDWTFERVERAAASYRSGVDVDLEQRGAWAGLLYTDRGVYRPGEAIQLSGVFRRVDAAGIRVAPGEAVRLTVTDAEGETVFDGRAQLDAYGGIALGVPVPKTSHLGEARIAASLGRKDGETFEQPVLIAAYKASEFKVAVEPGKKEYVRGEDARFDVHAEYLFGAPMGAAPAHNHVSRSVTYFAPPHAEGFVTSDEASAIDHPETNPNAGELRTGDGALDDDGRLSQTVKLDLPRMRGPESVTFETEVEDLTHQTVAHRASVLVHPAQFYLGLERIASRFLAVGAEVPARLAAFLPQGGRVHGMRARVELVRRTWTGVVEDQAADLPKRRSTVVDEVAGACDVTTTPDVVPCALRLAKPGLYILRARARDALGNDIGASTSFYAVDDRADDTTASVAWADPDSRGLKLETDKKQYDVGDVAKVLVRSPFKEADALVTVERAGVLWQRVVTLRGPMPVVEVPVTAGFFPNAYVAVHLVRGRVQAPPEVGAADVGAPDFRMGIVPVALNPDTHRLKVSVATSKKEYRPGEQVDADVTVSDRAGKGARAAVTFYAVDEGVLMLTSYETPDPLPPFAGNQRLAVFSAESREGLARLLPMKNGERVRPLGYEYAESAHDDKGGDGGGGGDGVRADFKTTAYFEAGRVTSDEGRAHYSFRLPDNLTTFRVMAVASAQDQFGAGEAAITTNRRLMARPAMPRIVRAGDAFEAGVIVSSRDLDATAVDVTLAASGVKALGPSVRRVQVPRAGSVEVRFPVKAGAAGASSFEFAVSGAGEKDHVLVKRTVDQPLDVETTSLYGETTHAAAIALGDMKGVRSDQGGLEVHVASTALVGLKTSFDRAIEYPYGCTEQLTSRILPLVVLPDMARLFGARMPAKVEDVVDEALGQLFEHQRSGGGFGFWEDDETVPWLSAYATLAAETAARKGYFVPKEARDRGVAYLRQVLDQSKLGDEDATGDPTGIEQAPVPNAADAPEDDGAPSSSARFTEKQKQTRAYATLAFIADVLATIGLPDPGYLNRLFDARAHRPLFTQALLLHAMAAGHMPRAELDTLGGEITARVRVDAQAAYVDEVDDAYADFLDSSSRTTALVLRALVASQPDHPLATRLARGLLDHRVNGAWRSTQENVWALLALDDYRRAQESVAPAFDARVFLGSDRLGGVPFQGWSTIDKAFTVDAARVVASAGKALSFEVDGEGRLFYSAELHYASTTLPDRAVDRGLFVQKLTRSLRPEELAAAGGALPKRSEASAPAGSLVLVDLLLESAEPREQLVIDDPLPAGLEPIDFALDTAAASQTVTDEAEKADRHGLDYGAFRTASGVHREQHDDKVLTFVPHVEPGLYHFRYLARATTPGDFVVPPTRAACMYAPDVSGSTAAGRFTVGAALPRAVRPKS